MNAAKGTRADRMSAVSELPVVQQQNPQTIQSHHHSPESKQEIGYGQYGLEYFSISSQTRVYC